MKRKVNIKALITPANYLLIAEKVELEKLAPKNIQQRHLEILQWQKALSWEELMEDKNVSKAIQDHFLNVRKWVDQKIKERSLPLQRKPRRDTHKSNFDSPNGKQPNFPKKPQKRQASSYANFHSAMPPAIRFIRRYKNLNGKYLTRKSLVLFLNSLQKAIVKKEIRNNSLYANEVREIQITLIKLFNGVFNSSTIDGVDIQIPHRKVSHFNAILKKHKILPAVRLIKRFVGLVRGPFDKAKYQRLQKAFFRAIETRKIKLTGKDKDPLAREIKLVMLFLTEAISSHKLEILPQTLNGLKRVVFETTNQKPENEHHGNIPKGSIIPSTAFNLTQDNRIGLPAYYKSIFGDLAHGFKMLIRGPRGAGKSTLAIQFANWLAKAGHRVLYIADEEGFSDTMHDRLERMGLKHSNLHLTDLVPDLSQLWPYDCIFIDSITSANLDLTGLEAIADSFQNSGKSMVLVGQVTTSGELRGGTRVPHKVDVEVETFKKGEPGKEIRYARTEKSRYGSGGMKEINTNDNYYETYFSHSA